MRRVGLVLAALVALAAAAPNFLVFLADDAGYGDVGIFGAPTVRTPNLDKMALEGMRFTQWYSPAPLCTPSRGALLTGRLPIRIGLYTAFPYPKDLAFRVFLPISTGSLPENETTVATLLGDAGYYSAVVGKWHLGHVDALPTRRGFDYFYGAPYSHDEGFPGAYPLDTVFPPVPVFENEELVEQPIVMSTYTDRMTTIVMDILEQRANDKQPFFMFVTYLQPHIPAFASPDFEDTSRRGHFGDMMEEMDASIGAIMAKLRDLGLDEDTLTVFSSDNGAWPDAQEPLTEEQPQPEGGSNGPFRDGKGSTWEGGMRVPTIMRWPGVIEPNQISMEIASHMDLFATMLDLADVAAPADRTIDGKSLAPLIRGDVTTGPHEFFYYWRESNLTAVRYGPWKAHWVTRPGFGNDEPVYHDPPLLFNIERDPSEQFPIDPAEIPDVLDAIIDAAEAHKLGVEPGIPQYETGPGGPIPGNDFFQAPCCDREAMENLTLRELFETKWAVCFCNEPDHATVMPHPKIPYADGKMTDEEMKRLTVIASTWADF